jgi:hypothetical protein
LGAAPGAQASEVLQTAGVFSPSSKGKGIMVPSGLMCSVEAPGPMPQMKHLVSFPPAYTYSGQRSI